MDQKLINILRKVEKPARYVGEEVCMPPVAKETRVKFCLSFPDVYEVGMSNIHFKNIYQMINDRKGYSCERCFAPWIDMGEELAKNNFPLYSLETKTSLNEFDIICFWFDQELNYSTFLYMLDLAKIPFRSKDRNGKTPIVIGIGNAMVNPEPLAEFLDAVIIGDVEDAVIKVIDTYNKGKLQELKRNEILEMLSLLEGICVPSKKHFTFENDKITKIDGDKVERQILRDLDRVYYSTTSIIPNEKSAISKGEIEIMRGCTKGCRFCRNGYIHRPIRERRVQVVMSHVSGQIYNSGCEEISLSALSINDYSHLKELSESLKPICEEKNVKVVMPTLRASLRTEEMNNISKISTFDLAIEAGTERLRNVINKNITDLEIENAFKVAFESGLSVVNLYFMIGLPFEKVEDLVGIVDIAKKAKESFKLYKNSQKPLNLNIFVSTFVPKAFTPFEWCAFASESEIEKKQKLLSIMLNELGVNVSFTNYKMNKIDAIFSRGDRKLADILELAYRRGAKFDSYENIFNYEIYEDIFKALNINEEKYLSKRETTDILPWDLVEIGITKQYFINEFEKAKEANITVDCKHGCNGCGLFKLGRCNNGHC